MKKVRFPKGSRITVFRGFFFVGKSGEVLDVAGEKRLIKIDDAKHPYWFFDTELEKEQVNANAMDTTGGD